MSAFIDMHHHFLYGVDDGAKTQSIMQSMLSAAYRDGVRILIATPHVVPGVVPFSTEVFLQQIEEARSFCAASCQSMEIHLGAEISYNYQACRFISEQRVPSLAGTGKVLLEFTPLVSIREIEEAVRMTLRSGCQPVLAHIERYPSLILEKHKLRSIKNEYEVYYQVDADQIFKGTNHRTNKAVTWAIREELIDWIASDAHDLLQRKCNLQAAYDTLEAEFGRTAADRLTGNGKSLEWFQNQ